MQHSDDASAQTTRALDEQILHEEIGALITPEVIEEHRRQPIGFHSDPLERILVYLRRQPQAGKYVVVYTVRDREWRIGRLSVTRGVAPEVVAEDRFTSLEAAEHAIFLRRLADLGLMPGSDSTQHGPGGSSR